MQTRKRFAGEYLGAIRNDRGRSFFSAMAFLVSPESSCRGAFRATVRGSRPSEADRRVEYTFQGCECRESDLKIALRNVISRIGFFFRKGFSSFSPDRPLPTRGE